jgi:Ca2+-binding RTX toxin-like protein
LDQSIENWIGNDGAVLGTDATDTFDFSGLTSVSGLSYVAAGASHDSITGTDFADDLRGNAGNDILVGGAGGDILRGGGGIDFTDGGQGDDTIVVSGGGAVKDTILGGDDADTILVAGTAALVLTNFNALDQSIESWIGNNRAVLGTGADDVFDFSGLNSASGLGHIGGGKGNDSITGTDFADDLRGNGGNDILVGGAGGDILRGGGGSDTFIFGAGFGHDTIADFAGGPGLGDVIQFEGLFADFAAVLASTQQIGAHSVITVTPDDTITLTNVAMSNLAANDFLFA